MPLSSSATTTTADHGGATAAITTVHPEIIKTHILTKLDGPALASAASTASQLRSLCSDEEIWREICINSWPSTADPAVSAAVSGHRNFFSDAFPTVDHRESPATHRLSPAPELISAVDIFYGENLIYSKVIVSETASGWFQSSPFRIDLLNMKETIPTPAKFSGDGDATFASHLRLSWILIDPSTKRAVNISSHKPVNFRRHWLTGDLKIRFSTVVHGGSGGGGAELAVVVMCEGKEGGELHVREASMQVEDMEGKIMNGKDSLVILQDAMERKRKKRVELEIQERYREFVEYKKKLKDLKQKREKRLDMACIAGGITVLFAFFTLVLLGSQRGSNYFLHFLK